MTVNPANTHRKLQLVEFFADQIRASYNDGSMEIDANLQEEVARGLSAEVDIFIPPREYPDSDAFIVSQERFRAQAALWGPVRDKLSQREENTRAQIDFRYAETRARIVFRDFAEAVRQGKVSIKKNEAQKSYDLVYLDPRSGIERSFHLYGNATRGERKSFQSLSLEEEDQVRVSISDERLLAPLRAQLDPIFSQWQRKNRR